MVLDMYTGCFSRIVWSPSIEVDNIWKPVKDYFRDSIKPSEQEKCYHDSYDPSELESVIKAQQKVIDYQKNRHSFYQIILVIDVFADDTKLTEKAIIASVIYQR